MAYTHHIQVFETQLEKYDNDQSTPTITEIEEEEFVPKTNVLIKTYVDNPCYECYKLFATPASLIRHMKTAHSVELPSRANAKSRPRSTKYQFVTKKSQDHRRVLFGCPSCWFYCKKDFGRMEKHVKEIHLDNIGEGFENPEDNDDAAYDDEDDIPREDMSTKQYMIAQIDELSAKFKVMFGL